MAHVSEGISQVSELIEAPTQTDAPNRGLRGMRGALGIGGALAVFLGGALMFSPTWGAMALWWALGITLLVTGIVNLVRAIMLRATTV